MARHLDGSEVFAWRLHLLLNEGVDYSVAVQLAQSEADTHELLDMLAAGCSPKVLLKIAC